MEALNKGTSVYHKVRALYSRSAHGDLLHISGKDADQIENSWPQVLEGLRYRCGQDDGASLSVVSEWENIPSLQAVVNQDDQDRYQTGLLESYQKSSQQIVGVILELPESTTSLSPFTKWFVSLIQNQTRLDSVTTTIKSDITVNSKVVLDIVHLFDSMLRNIVPGDEWEAKGRAVFTKQVVWFVARNATIEACLPAFPCKSSNLEKVNGLEPDKGEELSLKRLDLFTKSVAEIYQPGAKVWIVSDGHVFSDCIGVEDHIVDNYGESLMQMHGSISFQKDVGFLSLRDIFFGDKEVEGSFQHGLIEDIKLTRPLNLPVGEMAETCRKVLMAGCQIEADALRAWISDPTSSVLALYRGFSKFMLEDLATHKVTAGMSKKKCKKLAAEVALEMISRNQAYSNMIELLFPRHIRLSIHAHKNGGPKFGIALLSNEECQTVESLDLQDMQKTADLLHIPTPWHNTACQIEGDRKLYIVKSNVIREALKSKKCTGQWIPASNGHGGYYSLKRIVQATGPGLRAKVEAKQGKTVTILASKPQVVVKTHRRPALGEIHAWNNVYPHHRHAPEIGVLENKMANLLGPRAAKA
ncbi:MAG: hypothetical protein M1814_002798 [Vezdaea aestivalis]|nr:MAG: hypothetical protein M1814_002798 [Vezdaea aestivalis]